MREDSYLLVSLKGQNICAYPSRNVPLSLWQYFPSRGRGYISCFLKILMLASLDRLLWKFDANPLERNGVMVSDVIDGLRDIDEECNELDLAVCWPHSSRSIARVYGYLINKKARDIVGYIKGASNSEDVEWLRNEIEAVCKLGQKTVTFRYPQFHKSAAFGPTELFARFDLLPTNKEPKWRLDSWADSIGKFKQEFARGTYRVVPAAEIPNLKWVQKFYSECDETIIESFRNTINGCDSMHVCATHGDMACHNFRFDGTNIWIFDWESYTEDGPILVDELTVFLCVRRFRFGWSVKRTLADLERIYPMSNPKIKREVIQAIAFILTYKLSMSDVLGEELVKYAKEGY